MYARYIPPVSQSGTNPLSARGLPPTPISTDSSDVRPAIRQQKRSGKHQASTATEANAAVASPPLLTSERHSLIGGSLHQKPDLDSVASRHQAKENKKKRKRAVNPVELAESKPAAGPDPASGHSLQHPDAAESSRDRQVTKRLKKEARSARSGQQTGSSETTEDGKVHGVGPGGGESTANGSVHDSIDGRERQTQEPADDLLEASGKRRREKRRDGRNGKSARAVETDEQGDEAASRFQSILEKKSKALKRAGLAGPDHAHSTGNAEPEAAVVHALQPLPQPPLAPEPDNTPAYSTLPDWLAAPVRVSPAARAPFTDLGIPAATAAVLAAKGYPDAFAVQTVALPLLAPTSRRHQGDLLLSAATGSGKTLAYALPIVRDISHGALTRLRAVVVLPTRELVRQAHDVLELCASAFASERGRKRVQVGIAVGSQSLRREQKLLVRREMRYDPSAASAGSRPHPPDRLGDDASDVDSDSDSDSDAGRAGADRLVAGHVWDYFSRIDVLVCTPGRLVDHLGRTRGFSLDYVRWLVVDEADNLLAQSFQGWLGTVMAALGPDSGGRPGARAFSGSALVGVRKVLLSATLTRDLGLLAPLRLRRPQLVVLDHGGSDLHDGGAGDDAVGEHALPALLRETAVRVLDPRQKPLYLLELLQGGGDGDGPHLRAPPTDGKVDDDSEPAGTALVFTKSNEAALRLARLLTLLLAPQQPAPSPVVVVGTLTSTMPTQARRAMLRAFAARRVRVLVASDLVARGIDLPALDHVVNYDLPASVAAYVHRVGRTARAGRPGHAWTLLPDPESGWFWGQIGKSRAIRRPAAVHRLRLENGIFGPDLLAAYEAALDTLGQEVEALTRNR